jgi:hypothetical protein
MSVVVSGADECGSASYAARLIFDRTGCASATQKKAQGIAALG